MQVRHHLKRFSLLSLGVIITSLLSSCQTAVKPAVVACTGTVLGVDVSQNPASQTPQMKLGYDRGELAIVRDKDQNVLMEFGYGGGTHNIYQRLAVGGEAVKQTAASAIFIKDPSGNVSPSAANAATANANASAAKANAEAGIAKAKAEEAKAKAEEAKALRVR